MEITNLFTNIKDVFNKPIYLIKFLSIAIVFDISSVLFPVALLLQMQLEKMNIRKNCDAFEPMKKKRQVGFYRQNNFVKIKRVLPLYLADTML